MTRDELPLEARSFSRGVEGVSRPDRLAKSLRAGFRVFERRVLIGTGNDRWNFARREALSWGIKRRSGFTVERPGRENGDDRRVVAGDNAWIAVAIGPVRVREPVRVVWAVDDESRAGFAYATLAGHPVSGEEAFIVERGPDDTVWLRIRSVSRAGDGAWRLLYPLLRLAQGLARSRYFRALAGVIGDAQSGRE